MGLSTETLDSMVEDLARLGNLPRDKVRLVVETASHASNEAVQTMARICCSLPDRGHTAAAMILASKILEEAMKKERSSISEAWRDGSLWS